MKNPARLRDVEALLAEEAHLHTLANSLLEGEADDLVQQTYLRAIQDRETRVKSPRSWLSRILRNLASNMRRGRDRDRSRDAWAAVTNLVPSSADLMDREEQRRALVHAMDGLDDVYRTVILLRYFEALPPRAIAERLDLPVATVWNRLRCGLARLRDRLDADHGGDRRAWALPLISLATPSLVISEAIIMGSKFKIAVVVAGFVTFAGGVIWSLPTTSATESSPAAIEFDPVALTNSAVATKENVAARVTRESLPPPPEIFAATTGSLQLTVIYGDDKSPASSIGFELRSQGARDPLSRRIRFRTDTAGRATVEGLIAGRYFLFPDLKTMHSAIEIRAGAVTKELIELREGVRIMGIVVGADDRPVFGAEILLSQFATVGDVTQVLTTTGADGRFSIRGALRHLLVGARAKGFARSEGYLLSSSEGEQVELRIVLNSAGGRIQGQILGPGGEPVSDARVQIGPDDPGKFIIMLPGGVQGLARRSTLVRSDANGHFEAWGMPLGFNEVRARAIGLSLWTGGVRVEAHATADIVIEMERGVEVSGIVSDANAEPLAGISIEVGNMQSIAYHQTRTAKDGSYQIGGLSSGEIAIRARDREDGMVRAVLQAERGEHLIWNVAFERGLELRGQVLDRDGVPVRNARLNAYLSGRPATHENLVGSARTDEQGLFSLPNCPDGESLRVGVHIGGKLVAERMAVRPDVEDLMIRLEADIKPSVRVRGIVVGPDGHPLRNAKLSVAGGVFGSDSDTGAFDLGPFVPGTLHLTVDSDGSPFFRSESRPLFANEIWDLGVIRIPAAGTLQVALHYHGDGLRPTLSVREVGREGDRLYSRYPATDHHTQMLVPGSYRLVVSGRGVANQSTLFEIRVDETTELAIDIEPGLRRHFILSLPSSVAPDHPVEMTIRGERGVVMVKTVLPRERKRIEIHGHLAPGDYMLKAATATAGGLAGSLKFRVEVGREIVPALELSLR